MAQFTAKQRKFINEYVICLNATEAARRAGYKGIDRTLRSIGSENLTKPNIRTEIDRLFQQQAMSRDEVIARLTAQARGDLADIPFTDGAVDWDKARESGVTHLLHSVQERTIIGKAGEIRTSKVRLYSSQRAIEILAKYHQLLTDKIQIDIRLVAETVEALEALGQDPTTIFNEIITRAAKVKHGADQR